MKAFVVEHYGKDGLRAADVPEPESTTAARWVRKITGTPVLGPSCR